MDIIDADTQAVVYSQTQFTTIQINGASHRTWRIGPIADGQVDAAQKKFFMKITRALSSTADFDYWVGWETNLTYVLAYPSSNLTSIETQEAGKDEIWIELWVDGCKFPNFGPNAAACDDNYAGIQDGVEIGSFKDDQTHPFMSKFFPDAGVNVFDEPIAPNQTVKFVDHLAIVLGEDDGTYDETDTRNFLPYGPFWEREIKTPTWHLGGGWYEGEYKGHFYLAHFNTMGQICSSSAQCAAPGVCGANGFCGH